MRAVLTALALASVLVAAVLGAPRATAGDGDAKAQAVLKVDVVGMT